METIPFTLHARAIRFLVTHQSGSIQKAVLEAVMNSIDAGATCVEVAFDCDTLKITDDGKGFASRAEIDNFFATFCAPHSEGDAHYGRFRMGRGQLFNLGPNVWRSGAFEMHVDFTVKDDDAYSFRLETLAEARVGTEISIRLKDPLTASWMMLILDELKRFLAWSETAVFVNGQRVSADRTAAKWDLETELFCFRASTSVVRGLEVYNRGVLVCSLPKHELGVSGVLVSKGPLDVNFARNEVLSSCSAFRRIKAALRQHAGTMLEKRPAMDANERAFVARQLAAGEKTWREFDSVKLFRDASGKAYSPAALSNMTWGRQWSRKTGRVVFSFAEPGDAVADNLLQTKAGLVLSAELLELFQVSNPPDFFNQIKLPCADKFMFVPFGELGASLSAARRILPKREYTTREACVLASLKPFEEAILEAKYGEDGQHWWNHRARIRPIRLGSSEVSDGWTDGGSYIALNRAFLAKVGSTESGFARLGLLLLHEYCHDHDDSNTHIHSHEFYEAYERMSDAVVARAGAAFSRYVTNVTRAAGRTSKQLLRGVMKRQQVERNEAVLEGRGPAAP